MPLIDIQCAAGHLAEVHRPVSDWPATPPCPECGARTEQVHLPRGHSFAADPVVVYRAPDGSFRFPGDSHGVSAAKYDRLGYTRLEARSFAEVRALEHRINRSEAPTAARVRERLIAEAEAREHRRRSDLFHQMGSMSERGRDLARTIIERNNRKPRKSGSGSGSTYVEAYD